MNIVTSDVDEFFPDPGEVDEAICGLCKEKMNIERCCYGPTNWTMSMSGSKRKHDICWCPNRESMWHMQARALFDLADKTPSSVLAKIYSDEAWDIIRARKATKEVSFYGR